MGDEHKPEKTDEPPFRFPATLAEAAACGLCPECYTAAPPAPRVIVAPQPEKAPHA